MHLDMVYSDSPTPLASRISCTATKRPRSINTASTTSTREPRSRLVTFSKAISSSLRLRTCGQVTRISILGPRRPSPSHGRPRPQPTKSSMRRGRCSRSTPPRQPPARSSVPEARGRGCRVFLPTLHAGPAGRFRGVYVVALTRCLGKGNVPRMMLRRRHGWRRGTRKSNGDTRQRN